MPLPPSQSAARPSTAMAQPADLPNLSKDDLILLRAGQRVQHQVRREAWRHQPACNEWALGRPE